MPMVGLGNLGVLLFHPMAQLMNFWCLDSQKTFGFHWVEHLAFIDVCRHKKPLL